MPSNTTLNPGVSGDVIATKERTHDGDATKVQVVTVAGVTGTEGSYTFADVASGGGVEAAALRVTLASDSTGVLSVDDNGSSLTVDNGGTFAVQATLAAETTKVIGTVNVASAQTLATVTTVGAVTAITNALPAGTNNIGDVDVLSLPASTNTIEVVGDAAHDAAAAGNPVLIGGYGNATEPADTSADGDATQLWLLRSGLLPTTIRDSVGDSAMDDTNNALRVNVVAGGAAGGTSTADDADFTAGTTAGTSIQGVYESSPTSVTDGDLGTVGITATRAMKVSIASGGIAGVVEDAASAGGEEGIMVLAVRRDSASSGVGADGDFAALSVTSDGSLRVSGGGGGTQYAVDAVGGATDTGTLALAVRDDALATLTPVDGDYTQLRTNARGAQWVALDSTAAQTVTLAAGTATNEVVGDAAADAAVAGNPLYMGARASTAVPTAMSADGDAVGAWADLNGALVVAGRIVDDAAFTPGTSRVHPIAFQADETATDSVDEGDAGCPRMTLDRKVIVTQYAHAAAGGHTPFKSLDLDESEEEVKGSGGKLFWIHAMNLAATKRYLKIYNNTAAGTTVGTTVPDLTFPIPTMGDTNGAGFCLHFGAHGLALGTGITVAATTGFADNDTGAPGANEVVFNCGYL
jgi:hypothetical protein